MKKIIICTLFSISLLFGDPTNELSETKTSSLISNKAPLFHNWQIVPVKNDINPLAENSSFYEILEIPEYATAHQITKAFKEQSKKYHPDKNMGNIFNTTIRIQQINAARDTLSDPETRLKYNEQLLNQKIDQAGSEVQGIAHNITQSEDFLKTIDFLKDPNGKLPDKATIAQTVKHLFKNNQPLHKAQAKLDGLELSKDYRINKKNNAIQFSTITNGMNREKLSPTVPFWMKKPMATPAFSLKNFNWLSGSTK